MCLNNCKKLIEKEKKVNSSKYYLELIRTTMPVLHEMII